MYDVSLGKAKCISDSSLDLFANVLVGLDFTRLKLVQGKKQDDMKENVVVKNTTDKMKNLDINKDKDITATFDAQDDEDVVF
jgi:hypothetical protein